MVTIDARSTTIFESPKQLSVPGSATFFSGLTWDEAIAAGTPPRWAGPRCDDAEARADFIAGAALLGHATDDLKPQQLVIADTLATRRDMHTIEAPRRSSKSTSIFAWIAGHCARRPNTVAAFSAQSGTVGQRMFREWAATIDRVTPPDPGEMDWMRFGARQRTRRSHAALFGEELAHEVEPQGRGFKIYRAAGSMRIEWDNGSRFLVLKPDAEAFRSLAADIVWLDEAQELDVEAGEDVLAGALPLMDTRPDPRIIVSGTTGEAQVGVFWELLRRLRNGDPAIGGCDWAVDPLVAWEELEDEDRAMALLRGMHPGLGTLTTEERMRVNYRAMPRPKWAREYLSLWPETAGDVAIALDEWNALRLEARPRKPEHVALGLAVAPGGASAAIVAAWRTSRGLAHVEVIEHRLGTAWLPTVAPDLLRRLRTSLGYDGTPDAEASVTEITRALRGAAQVHRVAWRELNTACVQILREIRGRTLRQQGQVMLDDAVLGAVRREVRGQPGTWLWGFNPGVDGTPLVGATVALRNWDAHHAQRGGGRSAGIITSTGLDEHAD